MFCGSTGVAPMVDFFGWSVWNRNKPAEKRGRSYVRLIDVTPEVEAEYLKKLNEMSSRKQIDPSGDDPSLRIINSHVDLTHAPKAISDPKRPRTKDSFADVQIRS
jgi:hypothetical protein